MTQISLKDTRAKAHVRKRTRTGRNNEVVVNAGAEFDHQWQDLLESDASATAKKWSVAKGLTFIIFAGIGLWALIFAAYRSIF
jgi:hypothetical protein